MRKRPLEEEEEETNSNLGNEKKLAGKKRGWGKGLFSLITTFLTEFTQNSGKVKINGLCATSVQQSTNPLLLPAIDSHSSSIALAELSFSECLQLERTPTDGNGGRTAKVLSVREGMPAYLHCPRKAKGVNLKVGEGDIAPGL